MSRHETPTAEPTLLEATVAVKDAVVVLGGQLAQTLAIADRTLLKAARDYPYMLLSGAASTGFIAGGGLAAPITRSLLRFGFKTASGFVLDAAMRAVSPAPLDPPVAPTSPPSPEDQRRETSSSVPSANHHVANP